MENAIELKQKEKQIAELAAKVKELALENKLQRKQIEDKSWDDIDQIKETNKELLSVEIKLGMESKAALVTKTGEWKTKKQEKEEKHGDITQKKLYFEALVNKANELTHQIAS